MGGNYEINIYRHLMEMMERCDSIEKELQTVNTSTKSEVRSMVSAIYCPIIPDTFFRADQPSG